ncbi:MAG: phosphate ABC transporter permease subunit PstC [Syntrophorhabdales bacterium]|nr:phosphate ABC transporter permease subunit PstC [Syntrophorhabdales bacterium]
MDIRRLKDISSGITIRSSLIFINSIAFLMALILFIKSYPILKSQSIYQLILGTSWHPLRGEFGFFPFIIGTIEVTVIAMALSIVPCLLCAIYLSEFAKKHYREVVHLTIDVLAGIPSVIYGLCGVIAIVPFVKIIGNILGVKTTGYSLLAGGIILAIMVCPVIISVTLEVLRSIPQEAREASIALGATRWETIRHVLFRIAKRGIVAAIVLGFARAFGETIAVMMVVGNVPKIPTSLFDPAYPLPALIANNYGEMMSLPLYDSALLFAAFILMLVVGIFSLAANLTLLKIERKGT